MMFVKYDKATWLSKPVGLHKSIMCVNDDKATWLSKPVGKPGGFLHSTMFVSDDKATWLSKPVGGGQANTECMDEVLGVQLATVAMQGADPEPHSAGSLAATDNK
jgi:hypothetical protein